jgi:hypothetical protein
MPLCALPNSHLLTTRCSQMSFSALYKMCVELYFFIKTTLLCFLLETPDKWLIPWYPCHVSVSLFYFHVSTPHRPAAGAENSNTGPYHLSHRPHHLILLTIFTTCFCISVTFVFSLSENDR